MLHQRNAVASKNGTLQVPGSGPYVEFDDVEGGGSYLVPVGLDPRCSACSSPSSKGGASRGHLHRNG
jgi:hypothetical protein